MKTLALVAICKNEEKHIERWLNSFLPVVDHVYLCDTGSTDSTVAIAKVVGKNKITIKSFSWIEDFSAARNFASEGVTEDYILWSDLDDSLRNPEAFLEWRKGAIESSDLWLANYNYAIDGNGNTVCSFVRERVYRNNGAFNWKYFLHEGINSDKPFSSNFISSWAIDHLRTPEDLTNDKGRNLKVFRAQLDRGYVFDARMQYYYGKELFEAGQNDEGLKNLMAAASRPELEIHDRTLCMQYACFIMMQKERFQEAINYALSALLIAPQRAEFFVIIGDSFVKTNRLADAIPFYRAAMACEPLPEKGFAGFIFQHKTAYQDLPRLQLARIYANIGRFQEAEDEARLCYERYKTDESKAVYEACALAKTNSVAYEKAIPCEDVVITCPGGLYEWDEKIYEERGIGGSETAAVEIARWIKKLTNRNVIVFNQRKEVYSSLSGVNYKPLEQMAMYFSQHKPSLHLAWRHNFKLTNAKTYLWSHDLLTPGAEKTEVYEKYLTLSPFHANYVHSMMGIPKEKIFTTRNGINPERFTTSQVVKDPNKVVYVSSPDRGLERAINICEIARTTLPDLRLEVFYGWSNLRTMGKVKEADHFDAITNKPWIKVHGNLPQKELMEQYKDAAVWLYPSSFLETNCISALETVLSGVYPLVRKYGALPDTLAPYVEKGMATCLDLDAQTFEDQLKWASELVSVIQERKWEKISANPAEHSWENVAVDFLKTFLEV